MRKFRKFRTYELVIMIALSTFAIGLGMGNDAKKCLPNEISEMNIKQFSNLTSQQIINNFCIEKGYSYAFLSTIFNRIECSEYESTETKTIINTKYYTINEYYEWFTTR